MKKTLNDWFLFVASSRGAYFASGFYVSVVVGGILSNDWLLLLGGSAGGAIFLTAGLRLYKQELARTYHAGVMQIYGTGVANASAPEKKT